MTAVIVVVLSYTYFTYGLLMDPTLDKQSPWGNWDRYYCFQTLFLGKSSQIQTGNLSTHVVPVPEAGSDTLTRFPVHLAYSTVLQKSLFLLLVAQRYSAVRYVVQFSKERSKNTTIRIFHLSRLAAD
ncbi:hypothetical protein B0I72DRAFT_171910 [Yarrowia lipolytica]|nr:hypothetical protein B0I72DRAFT_171910 [Yarrowia lipolytica]RDW43723.1 hypothetical protein B0I74DRAFT_175961 [Yarrowia lipolytica]RDW51020.1 hypothetical protein B0I75DRAFT_159878 [Yarrowia lipolytica]